MNILGLDIDIITFKLEDLVNRIIDIRNFKDDNYELIVAQDINTKEIFIIKEIIHSKDIIKATA